MNVTNVTHLNAMNADIIRKIVKLDMSLANPLMKTCKNFNRWISENKNTMINLGKHYQNLTTNAIQTQLIRFFMPNKQKIHRQGMFINGTADIPISLQKAAKFIYTQQIQFKIFNPKFNVEYQRKRI